MAGLDPVLGFIKRTVEDIKTQVENDLIDEISPSLDVSSTSPVGQFIGSQAKVWQELWDLAEDEYVATDPDRNGGDAQDAVCAITGTTREPATRSQALSVTVNLNIGTTLTSLSSLAAVATNPSSQFRFRGLEPAPGDPVVEANFVAPATGNYATRWEAVNTGPVAANAATLTVIVTPVSGWNSISNPTDAIPGHDIETDSALRIRREEELFALGSTPLDALQAELSKLLADNGVVGTVSVFENVLDTVDGAGRPGHSIEALINDGGLVDDDDIAQTIWDGRGGGIQTFGSDSGNAVGRDGVSRTMNFNRPTLVPIYFAVTVLTDPSLFPVDGDVQIKDAMVLAGARFEGRRRQTDDDVIQSTFYGPIYSIPGVIKVTVLNLGTAPAPGTATDITIALRELATFDTGRIGVVVT